MIRGCLSVLLGAMILVILETSAFIEDPIRALWAVADLNGGLSKWEDRTVRVIAIGRDCTIDEAAAAKRGLYFASEDCGSPANLRKALEAKLREQIMGQPCFDEGSRGKQCPGTGVSPYSGTATITVAPVNKSDGEFTSTIRVDSNDSHRGYFILRPGDVLVAGICQANPSIGRIGARFGRVKGC